MPEDIGSIFITQMRPADPKNNQQIAKRPGICRYRGSTAE